MVEYPLCRKCGASHGMGIEDMETGKIEPIDLCKSCLFEKIQIHYDPHINLENLDKYKKLYGIDYSESSK